MLQAGPALFARRRIRVFTPSLSSSAKSPWRLCVKKLVEVFPTLGKVHSPFSPFRDRSARKWIQIVGERRQDTLWRFIVP